jgi:hypothetical protein
VSEVDESDRERGTTEVNFKGGAKDPRSNGGDEGRNTIGGPGVHPWQAVERQRELIPKRYISRHCLLPDF